MKKELGPMAKLHGGPDNMALGGKNSTGPEAMSKISKNIPDLFKDVKQIKGNIKENIQYPKYGDSDAKFMEGKDEGEFTMFEGKPPYRLKSKELTTGKTYYQGENGPQATDPDVKAAKKQIRKGANVMGGGNIIDDFGSKHGYQSDKTKELESSRLVKRKKRQHVKSEAKSDIKQLRSKKEREGFKSDEFTQAMSNIRGEKFTAKDGNKLRKDEIKRLKKEARKL